jgi:hypothetical protein
MSMSIRLSIAASLLLASHLASAAELKILGAKLDLPFAYKRVETGQVQEMDHGLESSESVEIEILDGPLQGQHVVVLARYWTPARTDAATLRKVLRESADEEAKRAATRETGDVRIDGFQFHYADRRVDNKKATWPESMGIKGEVSASMYSLFVFAKDTTPLTPAMSQALKTATIDFETLVRVRGRFDDEAHAAVQGTALETPIGRVDLGNGGSARLLFSSMRRDGDGRQLGRTRGFAAHKQGFWNVPSAVTLSFGCSVDQGDIYENVLSLYDDNDSVSIKERSVQTGVREPVTFLGRQAVAVTGKGPEMMGGTRPSIRRMALRADGTIYVFTVTRDGGAKVADIVTDQLTTATPACRVEPARGPEGTPATPKPAAGADATPRVSVR